MNENKIREVINDYECSNMEDGAHNTIYHFSNVQKRFTVTIFKHPTLVRDEKVQPIGVLYMAELDGQNKMYTVFNDSIPILTHEDFENNLRRIGVEVPKRKEMGEP